MISVLDQLLRNIINRVLDHVEVLPHVQLLVVNHLKALPVEVVRYEQVNHVTLVEQEHVEVMVNGVLVVRP
jgi:hypothetical protein